MFAGEHTEIQHAWMDTAIKSGVRAAAEIHLDEDWTKKRGVKYNRTPVKIGQPRYEYFESIFMPLDEGGKGRQGRRQRGEGGGAVCVEGQAEGEVPQGEVQQPALLRGNAGEGEKIKVAISQNCVTAYQLYSEKRGTCMHVESFPLMPIYL